MIALLGDVLNTEGKKVPKELQREDVQMFDRLGEGAFGDVSKALFHGNKKLRIPAFLVAVKILKETTSSNRTEFVNEAAILAQFENEYVVNLVGVVTMGEPLLLVVEYCERGSLQGQLVQDRFSYREKMVLMGDCAEGMHYLHSLRFIHRDIAARNILVGFPGQNQ